jgi:diguanylate cyclase
MMDLNNFKRVNDTYGHVVGDEVLRAFGEVLRKACRKMDLPVRYGGDEFILVLPETDVQDVSVIQSRIKDFFKPISEKYAHVGLSISFGVATSEGKSIEEIMQMADDHLYKNKNALKSMVTL